MKQVTLIIGPTASGKSALAMQKAAELNGEIVSADSMQLYRALPIGTAQPTVEEVAAIPHHLVGILELQERADVFSFCRMADEAIADILKRGKHPVICGGTGLYIRALFCGMDDLPADRELRRSLDLQYDSDEGEKELHRLMSEIDPEALVKWHDCRRKLIRALEVITISGKSILVQQHGFAGKFRYDADIITLDPDADELKKKIRRRAEIMLANGWIEEAEKAISNGLFESPTAHQALGYRQIAEYLAGTITRERLLDLISTATWQYARRQRTWFRHQPPGGTPAAE